MSVATTLVLFLIGAAGIGIIFVSEKIALFNTRSWGFADNQRVPKLISQFVTVGFGIAFAAIGFYMGVKSLLG